MKKKSLLVFLYPLGCPFLSLYGNEFVTRPNTVLHFMAGSHPPLYFPFSVISNLEGSCQKPLDCEVYDI